MRRGSRDSNYKDVYREKFHHAVEQSYWVVAREESETEDGRCFAQVMNENEGHSDGVRVRARHAGLKSSEQGEVRSAGFVSRGRTEIPSVVTGRRKSKYRPRCVAW